MDFIRDNGGIIPITVALLSLFRLATGPFRVLRGRVDNVEEYLIEEHGYNPFTASHKKI
jgi:hypothetical protein